MPTFAAAHPSKHHKASRCKAGYVKQIKVIHKTRGHHMITKKVSVCVPARTAGGSGGSGGTGGSGRSGGSGGSGASGASGPPSVSAEAYAVAANASLGVGAPGVLEGARGSGLSAQLTSGPGHGTVTIGKDGSFTYTPTAGFVGTDSFSYKATDASFNSSNIASVTISVTPLVNGASYSATSGTPLSIPTPGVLAGAVGSGLAAHIVAGASHGTLSLSANGSLTYTSTPGYTGADSFTFQATDSAGAESNTATITINVAQSGPPEVQPQIFTGAIANTELQVAGSRGAGPEVLDSGANALSGDSDPGGGTLSTTPGSIATAQGGTVSMAADGSFTYEPPAGYEGPSDSFSYHVDSTTGQSSAATATIDFASGRVWYVNSAASAGGTGTTAAPFATMAGAAAVAGSGDVIFLETGPSYGGGVTLGAHETLQGQSLGLQVDGETLLAPSGSAPTITNLDGAGITLGEGDAVAGVEVAGTSGPGIVASGIGSFTLESSVTVSDAGADGIDINGGDGAVAIGAAISGSGGHSVSITNRSGGLITLAGNIADTGGGIALNSNGGATIDFTGKIDASTGTNPAFTATGGGTVEATDTASTLATTTGTALDVENTTIGTAGLTFQSISAGSGGSGGPGEAIVLNSTGASGPLTVTGVGYTAGSGGVIEGASDASASAGAVSLESSGPVSLTDMTISASASDGIYDNDGVSLTVLYTNVTGSGANAIELDGGTATTAFDLENDTLTGQAGDGIQLVLGSPGTGGWIKTDTIGTAGTTGSGSSTGDGIQISNGFAGFPVDIEHNTIQEIAVGNGIAAQALTGGELDLTVANNTIAMDGTGSQDAAVYAAQTGSTFCLASGGGNNDSAAGASAYGTSVSENGAGAAFKIAGYTGTATDTSAVASYLENDTQDSLGGGAFALIDSGATNGFAGASCQSPGTGGGIS